jgi:hypothetical protein
MKFYHQVWEPIRNWINKLTKRNNDDDQFNNPYLVL